MQYLLHKSKKFLALAALSLVLLTTGAEAQEVVPPTVAFHLQCYPSKPVKWYRHETWPSKNCDSFNATYIRRYKDNNINIIFILIMDGKVVKVKPRRLTTFQPLSTYKLGDRIEVEFDGYFQDLKVRHTLRYWGLERTNDPKFMSNVMYWDTRYLHLNKVKE